VRINDDNTSLEELFESDVQMPRQEVGMEEVDKEENSESCLARSSIC
jgi:hypothetical protein